MTLSQPLMARSCGLILLLSLLTACAVVDDPVARAMRKVTPYRIEVVQGNFVSKEQVQALRPGMTRNQVKEILGTPLIASVFHADRWDYAFTIRRKGTPQELEKFRQSSPPSTPVEPVVDNAAQRKQYPPLEAPNR